MGEVTWAFEGHVEASPDAVYAWLTDFSGDDHASEAYRRGAGVANKKHKPSSRTVLSREGNVLRIEDRSGRSKYTSTVTLDPAARAIRIQGGFGYDSTWSASPEGSGTKLAVRGQAGHGLVGSLMRLFAGPMRRSMGCDFNGHLEDARASLGK